MGHTYSKKLFIGYMKFKFNWVSQHHYALMFIPLAGLGRRDPYLGGCWEKHWQVYSCPGLVLAPVLEHFFFE